jgi:hypothetical protein
MFVGSGVMNRIRAVERRSLVDRHTVVDRERPGEHVTRLQWFERGLAVSAGLASGGIVADGFASLAASSPSHGQDVNVLNFLLAFETLQADFYAGASRDAALHGEWRRFAQTVGAHERAHVAFLRRTLGVAVKPTPRFELRRVPVSLDEFQRLAVTLEDVGVALYDGQAGNLTAGSLAAAAAILSVEARHAAWVRDLAGEEPAPVASDVPADATEVQARLTRAGVAVV